MHFAMFSPATAAIRETLECNKRALSTPVIPLLLIPGGSVTQIAYSEKQNGMPMCVCLKICWPLLYLFFLDCTADKRAHIGAQTHRPLRCLFAWKTHRDLKLQVRICSLGA